MSVLATIRDLFAPLSFSAREIRQENLSVAEANRLAARELLDAERRYWRGRFIKATTAAEVKAAREELDKLDEQEAVSRALGAL